MHQSVSVLGAPDLFLPGLTSPTEPVNDLADVPKSGRADRPPGASRPHAIPVTLLCSRLSPSPSPSPSPPPPLLNHHQSSWVCSTDKKVIGNEERERERDACDSISSPLRSRSLLTRRSARRVLRLTLPRALFQLCEGVLAGV